MLPKNKVWYCLNISICEKFRNYDLQALLNVKNSILLNTGLKHDPKIYEL